MKKYTVTIASGGTKSTGLEVNGRAIVKIAFPTMTGTTATVQDAPTDSDASYKTVGDAAGNLSIVSPSGRSVRPGLEMTNGGEFIRIVSGSAEGADRSIDVYVSDFLG